MSSFLGISTPPEGACLCWLPFGKCLSRSFRVSSPDPATTQSQGTHPAQPVQGRVLGCTAGSIPFSNTIPGVQEAQDGLWKTKSGKYPSSLVLLLSKTRFLLFPDAHHSYVPTAKSQSKKAPNNYRGSIPFITVCGDSSCVPVCPTLACYVPAPLHLAALTQCLLSLLKPPPAATWLHIAQRAMTPTTCTHLVPTKQCPTAHLQGHEQK